SLAALGEQDLHAKIPVAVLMQLLQHAHREIAARGRVERPMEMPIQRTPSRRLAGAPRILELVEHVVRALQLLATHARNGASKQVALDVRAQLEELVDLIERETRHHGTAVRIERDEPFRLELTERLANRNPAHAKLVRKRVLAKWLAVR